MSRAPPFPTRRPRTPPSQSQNGLGSPPTRPLQISRDKGSPRPTISGNNGLSQSPQRIMPSRPQRSELRGSSRTSEYSDSERSYIPRPPRGSEDLQDIPSSSGQYNDTYRPRTTSTSTTASTMSRPSRSQSGYEAAAALPSVISAFQNAGKRRGTQDASDVEYELAKKQEAEKERQRQERIKARAPGRQANGRARAGDIDAVLDQIKDEWEFIIDPDFNPVDLAIQLLDESSMGKDIDSFRRTKIMLSKALKGSVDKHYQAFAASLPHHASLLNHLDASSTQIKEMRSSLQEAKENLGNKRADLMQLWTRGQTVEEMIKLLDEMETLKAVPDILETLISEKRLLQASVLLVRSLKMVNKPDMQEIGAVSDLRAYLNGQDTALRDILVDELQSHLYLKSFWCESRWASYSPNQQSLPRVDFENEPLPSESSQLSQALLITIPDSAPPSRLSRFLNNLSLKPNDPPHDVESPAQRINGSLQPSGGMTTSTSLLSLSGVSLANQNLSQRNPEADSFAYIETLLEALAVLGKLGSALDLIAQRLPNEIFALVEGTLNEVEDRAEFNRRTSVLVSSAVPRTDGVLIFSSNEESLTGSTLEPTVTPTGGIVDTSRLRLAGLESSAQHADQEILKDFFWTVYSKLDAVSQGLRLIYEISNRIGNRRDFKDSSGAKPGTLFPVSELWLPVQAEVRTLLHDYLTSDEQSTVAGRNPISSINEVLREGKYIRDKSKSVFRFADADFKTTTRALRSHEDELTRVLRDTVPGLVQGSLENAAQSTLATVGTDDRLIGADQHHRTLVKPDAFHVSVLFQPTLCFLERVSDILPAGSESMRSSDIILDDFVLKVYLPQLEEKVSGLFHQAVSSADAFQPDPSSSRLSHRPLIKAGTQSMALVNSLCSMLQQTPFHQDNYTRLILSVIIQFYQRCYDKFQALVTLGSGTEGAEPKLALASRWAQRPEMNACLSELLKTDESDDAMRARLCRQEDNLEFSLLSSSSVSKEDLVASIRNLAILSNLYHTVTWFTAELSRLKAVTDDTMSPTSLDPTVVTPFTPSIPSLPQPGENSRLQLPLSKEMAMRFQSILRTYESLAELIIHTVRIDIRCRVMHFLNSAMRQGNYRLEREAGELDPDISDLNAELASCDDFISTTLPEQEQRFVFAGIGRLLEDLLILNARYLRLVNEFGIKKIFRNMLALQQSIKALQRDGTPTDIDRAKLYYAMYFRSPTDMLESIRVKQIFSFDEYRTMLNLQCGVNQAEGDAGKAKATDRSYSIYILDLLQMENANEEEDS